MGCLIVGVSGCQLEKPLDGLPCDHEQCVSGFECNPVTRLCIQAADRGCSEGQLCWETVQSGDACTMEGNFVGCANADDCAQGCRTCQDGEWSQCVYLCGADRDQDGDQHDAIRCGGLDCNDADPAIHPTQFEVCDDSIDNNCDGAVDCADVACHGLGACADVQHLVIGDITDTYVSLLHADATYGQRDSLHVDAFPEWKESYLKADHLGSLTAANTVLSVHLVLNVKNAGSAINVMRVLDPWDGDVSWRSRPRAAEDLMAVIGGSLGEKRIEVTDFFRSWVDGTHPNHGLELRPTGRNGVQIHSHQSSDPTLAPRFEVVFR